MLRFFLTTCALKKKKTTQPEKIVSISLIGFQNGGSKNILSFDDAVEDVFHAFETLKRHFNVDGIHVEEDSGSNNFGFRNHTATLNGLTCQRISKIKVLNF